VEEAKMNEDACRRITEKLLGEEWHKWDMEGDVCLCGRRVMICMMHTNRTFTTWQDFGDCFEKLVEVGKWEEFYEYLFHACEVDYHSENPDLMVVKIAEKSVDAAFYYWLLSRTESGHYRLCVLCAEWLKGQR
jgi:hypothetical protein